MTGTKRTKVSSEATTTIRKPGRALITGASSGIGRELARVFAEHGHDLVITARRKTELRALAAQLTRTHAVEVKVLVADLADRKAPRALFDACAADGLEIDFLVNNAGYGAFGDFDGHDRKLVLGIIDVNVRALTALTHLFMQPMLERGRGRIMNVASLAGFQSGPRLAVYSATKAYALSLSEALATELAGSGVTVTALCPGATQTEFGKTADMEGTLFFALGPMSAADVAGVGYDAMMSGTAVVVPGLFNWLATQVVPLLPRALVRRLVHTAQVKL